MLSYFTNCFANYLLLILTLCTSLLVLGLLLRLAAEVIPNDFRFYAFVQGRPALLTRNVLP